MKIQKVFYVLSATFVVLMLSSCSRGYGCDYGATELKPLNQAEELVLVSIENNENINEITEMEVLTD